MRAKNIKPYAIRIRPQTVRGMSWCRRRAEVLEGRTITTDELVAWAISNLMTSIRNRAHAKGISVEELDRRAGITGEVEADAAATTGPPSKVEPRLD